MAVMVEIMSQRVNDFLVRFLFLCKSVLSFCEVNFGGGFIHQLTRITSRCQACFKVFFFFCSNTILEEFVLRSLTASLLMKPFLTPAGWQLL